MQLDSVRNLKASVQAKVVAPLAQEALRRATLALSAQPMHNLAGPRRAVALGITRKGRRDFQLAVRVQRPELVDSPQVAAIVRQARGEADVRYIGRVAKRAVPWNRKNVRPLRIGTSIGHHRITAGTLGCFVTRRADDTLLILSNNHVLANENDAKAGDAILQRGAFDGGTRPKDVVGKLAAFVRLKKSGANLVDAAVASINPGVGSNLSAIRGLGTLVGEGPAFLDEGTEVHKLGRTTGVTHGKVTAFELDNVVVGYDIGDLRFDDQIEIEGAAQDAFSAGGDSGSLIVDAEGHGVALLFAGGDQGGANGKGLTYASPIRAVLEALKVDLAF